LLLTTRSAGGRAPLARGSPGDSLISVDDI
jgi:hypothetical protein